ncbi:hypothetical protein FBEOM_4448 [Fusarium beomiforme]|uniref:Uncharacterized protein n=1 Tax=Fusarium beomiforme TaxID=44412 RepID=A0A9P5DY50_9HYPO|nr:hypothetical protein FBEOM_4448 [Fusarium beomiforme]
MSFDPITIGRFSQTIVDRDGGYNNHAESIYYKAVARENARPGNFFMILSIGAEMDQLRKALFTKATKTDTTAAPLEITSSWNQIHSGFPTFKSPKIYMEKSDRDGTGQITASKHLLSGYLHEIPPKHRCMILKPFMQLGRAMQLRQLVACPTVLCSVGTPPRKEDTHCIPVTVGACNWVSTELRSGYAPEVRVANLWMILASYDPRIREYTHQPNTSTSVHICDL